MGTAAAKKRSTTATQTSARDVATAGASCGDGSSEEDVHNSDASERWQRPAPEARTSALRDVAVAGAGGAGNWPRPVPAARTGMLPPGTWPWQRNGRDGRAYGWALLYACYKAGKLK